MDTEMNERIRELAEQAGLYVDLAGQPWPRAMSAEECEVAYTKFAELIVRECISCSTFIGITTHNSGLGPQPIRYTSMVNDKIRKHFGVEE